MTPISRERVGAAGMAADPVRPTRLVTALRPMAHKPPQPENLIAGGHDQEDTTLPSLPEDEPDLAEVEARPGSLAGASKEIRLGSIRRIQKPLDDLRATLMVVTQTLNSEVEV